MNTNLTKDFFDRIGKDYEHAYANDDGLLEFIQSAIPLLPPNASILDVGCGTGHPVCTSLVKHGFKITGIDRSRVMVDLCRTRLPDGKFAQIDMLDYDPDVRDLSTTSTKTTTTEFNAIFSIFSMFAFSRDQVEQMLGKFSTWLEPEGWLFVGTIPADGYLGLEPSNYDADGCYASGVKNEFMGEIVEISLLSKRGWRGFLEHAGFEVVETKETEFKPNTGETNDDWERHYWIMAKKVAR